MIDAATTKAINAITAERERQKSLPIDGLDSTNSRNDWVSYITAYVGRATLCARNDRECESFRENMVKVGALAAAAIEAFDEGKCV